MISSLLVHLVQLVHTYFAVLGRTLAMVLCQWNPATHQH